MVKDKYSHPSSERALCWECKNAVPNALKGNGCSWSRRLQPVEGWEAIEQNPSGAQSPGYRVVNCPEFVEG